MGGSALKERSGGRAAAAALVEEEVEGRATQRAYERCKGGEAGCEFLHLPLISVLWTQTVCGTMEDVYSYTRSPAWEELVSNDSSGGFCIFPLRICSEKEADERVYLTDSFITPAQVLQ